MTQRANAFCCGSASAGASAERPAVTEGGGDGGIFVGGEAQPARTASANVMAVNASLRGGEESGLYILPDSVLHSDPD